MYLALLHFGLSAHQLLALLSAALLGFVVAKVIYRLFFHPLANVPGPRLAAATWLYEIYYDLVQGGQFVFQLRKLHEKYGTCSAGSSLSQSSLWWATCLMPD
jgi:hypothetical protein